VRPRIEDLFTQSDLDRVARSVAGAEHGTSAEIVPFIVGRSDAYDEAVLRGGLLGAVLTLGVLWGIRAWTPFWIPFDLTGLILFFLLFTAGAMIAVRETPLLLRSFAGRELLRRRTLQRATEAFVSEEVFATKQRSGILIFISILERTVHVIGDSGINKRVGAEEWRVIADSIAGSIRAGNAADGLMSGLQQCHELLHRHGFRAAPDDRNELRDDVRTGGPR